MFTHLLEGKTPCRPIGPVEGGLVWVYTAAGEEIRMAAGLVQPRFGSNPNLSNTASGPAAPRAGEPRG